MPELPEVEIVRQQLLQVLPGKEIVACHVLTPRIVRQPEVAAFEKRIVGSRFGEIWRRGKYLLFQLGKWELVTHLRMEGRFGLFDARAPLDGYTHLLFTLNGGSQLRYRDVRKFGTMDLLEAGQAASAPFLAGLGPDALDLSYEDFATRFQRPRQVKALLLDQHVLAGVGNIYADEALWRARVHPSCPADRLSEPERRSLYEGLQETLHEAIACGGSTVRSFVDMLGHAGQFQLHCHVYGRQGEPCERCKTPIVKAKIAGRGTSFCPQCQRLRTSVKIAGPYEGRLSP
ncbi:MAG: DNA-formamidopyrimidine glycosylase [Firmicutes bacterium]|nr:DNA-formamidopyrimidine glycosylase [Bacillota bacterium]